MSLTRAPRGSGDVFADQGCPALDSVLGRAPMRLAPTPLVHVGRLVSCARQAGNVDGEDRDLVENDRRRFSQPGDGAS